ncbi:MAG: hypothetical protein FWE68_02855 [Defluviitaleaceae bacterium]|nr:hypothetical protein [Defluviitaleaceae bacterium]
MNNTESGGFERVDNDGRPIAFEGDAESVEKEKFAWSGWKIAALSPFVYVMLGMAFGWWAWAWVIIPVSAILFADKNEKSGKKKKKDKEKNAQQ